MYQFQDTRYKVYRLTNHTLGEIYIGISRDTGYRIDQHAGVYAGGARTIEHWDWNSDDIAVYTYPLRFNSPFRASEYAHDSERLCRLREGYQIFLTGGC